VLYPESLSVAFMHKQIECIKLYNHIPPHTPHNSIRFFHCVLALTVVLVKSEASLVNSSGNFIFFVLVLTEIFLNIKV